MDTPEAKGCSESKLSDVVALAKNYKFWNCTHIIEPGGAILKVLNDNTLGYDFFAEERKRFHIMKKNIKKYFSRLIK